MASDVTFISGSGANGTGTTALTVTIPASAVGGVGILITSIRSAAGTAKVTGITGSTGTWVHVGDIANSTPTVITSMFYCLSVSASGTATCTISGTATETSCSMGAYSSVATVVSAGFQTNTGTGTAPSVSLTTTGVRSVVVAGMGIAYAVAQSATTGNLRSNTSTGSTSSGVGSALLDNTLAPDLSPVTVTSASSTDSSAWSAIAMELQPSAPAVKLTVGFPKSMPGLATRIAVPQTQATVKLRGTTAIDPVKMPFPYQMTLTPSSFNVVAGLTQQLQAALLYSNNFSVSVTTDPATTYSSNNTAVATVSSTGLVTAVAVGTTTIQAMYSKIGVGNFSVTSGVTVTPATLVSIAVTPANDLVLPSAVVNYTATGTYTDGSTVNITTSCAWTSSATGVATIISGTGVATANANPSSTAAPGITTITATDGSVSGSTTLIVEASLLGIVVAPESFSLAKGLTQQMSAQGTYSSGTVADLTSSVTWSSGTPGHATITTGGLLTAVAAGTSLIGATFGTFSDSITATVTAASLVSIAVTPADPVISPLGTEQFTATGTYSDGSMVNITGSVSWASSQTSIATINSSGLATATASLGGVTAITATSGLIVGTTALVVQSTASPTLNSITATPNSVILTFSASVDNLQTSPSAWTVGIIGSPTNVAPVTVTAIAVVGAVVTLTTTTQTGGATYVLNIPSTAITSTTGYPFLGPFAQDFTGGSGLTNTFVVTVIDAQTLLVTFQRPVMETGTHGALQTSNYSLNHDNPAILGVTAVTAAQYVVTTAPQTYGTVYTLTVSNVWDTFFNPI